MSEKADPVPSVRAETNGSAAMAVTAGASPKPRPHTGPETRGIHPGSREALHVVPPTGLQFQSEAGDSQPRLAEIEHVHAETEFANADLEAAARSLGGVFSHVNDMEQAVYHFLDSARAVREEVSIQRDCRMSEHYRSYVEDQLSLYAEIEGESHGP